MIDLSAVPKKLDHWVRLHQAFQSDLHWLDVFLEDWNGVALCSSVVQRPPAGTVTSDALGWWGCGAFTDVEKWFQFLWPAAWEHVHITVKELLSIVVACAVWGHQWHGCSVRCMCNNAAVVTIIKAGTSKDPLVMHLMLKCTKAASGIQHACLSGDDNTDCTANLLENDHRIAFSFP